VTAERSRLGGTLGQPGKTGFRFLRQAGFGGAFGQHLEHCLSVERADVFEDFYIWQLCHALRLVSEDVTAFAGIFGIVGRSDPNINRVEANRPQGSFNL